MIDRIGRQTIRTDLRLSIVDRRKRDYLLYSRVHSGVEARLPEAGTLTFVKVERSLEADTVPISENT